MIARNTSVAVSPLKSTMRALFADPRDKAFVFALDRVLLRPEEVDEARLGAGDLTDLLADLARASGGAVAVLSDRPLEEVDRILAPLRLPGCGRGGLEVRVPGGSCIALRSAADLDPVRRFVDAAGRVPVGLAIEDEGLAIVLRHDGAGDLEPAARRIAHEAVALAPAVYRVRASAGAVKVTFAGASRGRALGRLMSCDFFSARLPVVFGCDVEDDEVYSAIRSFGGTAIQVGSRSGHEADIVVPGSNDVRWLIRDFLADLAGRPN